MKKPTKKSPSRNKSHDQEIVWSCLACEPPRSNIMTLTGEGRPLQMLYMLFP
jgi:hypothetical protein